MVLHRPASHSSRHRLDVILVVFLLLFMSACDHGQPDVHSTQADPTLTLRFGHDMPLDSAQHEAAVRFAELVKQRSENRLNITIHPAQSLGNDYEMIAMAQSGELDIILPPTAKLSPTVPAFQIMDLPFFFHDRNEAYRVLDGPAGIALFKKTLAEWFNRGEFLGERLQAINS